MSMKVIRLVNFQVSTSATTTSDPVDVDYRFDVTPVRSFFVQKGSAAGPSIFLEAAPTTAGPWIPFAEVTAGVTTTLVQTYINTPYVRSSYAGGGPLVTIIGIV